MAIAPSDPGAHRHISDEGAVIAICALLNSGQEWNTEMVVQIARIIWNANREVSRLQLRGRGRQ
jgi:hypothetical protein